VLVRHEIVVLADIGRARGIGAFFGETMRRKREHVGQHQDQFGAEYNPAAKDRDCAITFKSARCCSDSGSGSAMKGTSEEPYSRTSGCKEHNPL